MDEEDLAEAVEAQKLQTSDAFSGLGSTKDDGKRTSSLMGLWKTEGETMGVKLLRKMGWRDGQGIGPRVRRMANLDDGQDSDQGGQDEHLFAPANSKMISFSRKDDSKGVGFVGESHLAPVSAEKGRGSHSDDEDNMDSFIGIAGPTKEKKPINNARASKGGFGVGVLNDLGSDDDDPYEIGPRISYSRVIGGDKNKAKTKVQKVKTQGQTANPLLSTKPVFVSKKAAVSGLKKCHDGRLPLNGFVLFDSHEHPTNLADHERWPKPEIPLDWKSTKIPPSIASSSGASADTSTYKSTADVARASQLDPKARAAILGEAQLPGKSIFDYLSTAARDRIASASGKANLPAALGEAPPKTHNASSFAKPTNASSQPQSTTTDIPDLDKDIALGALGRGLGGWTPYADDPAKLIRYRGFLEYRGGITASLPSTHRLADVPKDAWLQELREFAHAAQVFRPMTGMMASRFTSSSASTPASSARARAVDGTSDATDDDPDKPILLQTPATAPPAKKPEDPAEAAAKMGMFGPLTRSVTTFFPTRLVCKRFGIKPPAHVQPDSSGTRDVPSSGGGGGAGAGGGAFGSRNANAPADLVSKKAMDEMMREAGLARSAAAYAVASSPGTVVDNGSGDGTGGDDGQREGHRSGRVQVVVDAERNEALEGNRAGDAVFRAIFGSDDEDG